MIGKIMGFPGHRILNTPHHLIHTYYTLLPLLQILNLDLEQIRVGKHKSTCN